MADDAPVPPTPTGAALDDPARSKPRSATDRVYASLKQEILEARRLPDTFLFEHDLAEEYGVSKTPVREALRLLAHDGWVTVLPRKGYMVRSLRLEDVHEIFEVRQMIEPAMAATAAYQRNADDIRALEHYMETQESAEDADRAFLAGSGFHLEIARISRNRRAEKVLRELLDELFRMRYLAPWLDTRLSAPEELSGHRLIYEAIVDGDSARAREVMSSHSQDSLLKKLEGFAPQRPRH